MTYSFQFGKSNRLKGIDRYSLMRPNGPFRPDRAFLDTITDKLRFVKFDSFEHVEVHDFDSAPPTVSNAFTARSNSASRPS